MKSRSSVGSYLGSKVSPCKDLMKEVLPIFGSPTMPILMAVIGIFLGTGIFLASIRGVRVILEVVDAY